jgi:MOSC domain-containing protein YiiM
VIEIVRRMQRCSMIVHAQADLARDRTVLRTLVAETGHTLGVAAEVVEPGPIAVGDPVELL